MKHAKPKPSRRPTLTVTAGLALVATTLCASPAWAEILPTGQDTARYVAAAPPGPTQTLRVSSEASSPVIQRGGYTAELVPEPVEVVVAEDPKTGVRTKAPADPIVPEREGPRATIVDTAMSYMGVPYVFAGSSYDGIDCSGLVLRAYEAVGVHLAHYVPSQAVVGQVITREELRPGDLVVFQNNEHIGIYLGDGRTVHAPAPGRNVQINDNWFGGQPLYYVRIIAD